MYTIKRSCMGDYWQVRVRDLCTGVEDTVDRCYTLMDAQRVWDDLSTSGLRPYYPRPAQ